jgi:hypothetical protein
MKGGRKRIMMNMKFFLLCISPINFFTFSLSNPSLTMFRKREREREREKKTEREREITN